MSRGSRSSLSSNKNLRKKEPEEVPPWHMYLLGFYDHRDKPVERAHAFLNLENVQRLFEMFNGQGFLSPTSRGTPTSNDRCSSFIF